MVTPKQPRFLPVLAFLVVALVSLAAPSALQAQSAGIPDITPEKLEQYVSAYVEIADVRERINAEFARTGNKITEAQDELRKQRREEVRQIIESNGLTEDEYEQITWVLSIDPTQREAFAQLIAQRDAEEGA